MQKLINTYPEHIQSYIDELKYLKNLVKSVDQNDDVTSFTSIEIRKNMHKSNFENQNINLTNAYPDYKPNITKCSRYVDYNIKFKSNGKVYKDRFKLDSINKA